jgi:hypothetical protein
LRLVLGREHDALSWVQPDGLRQSADANAGSLQIKKKCRGRPPACEHSMQLGHPASPNLLSAMGGIDSNHIHACVQEGNHFP